MEIFAAFYGGEFFRSEHEARWAVFFDALRLKWRYERGGFNGTLGSWVAPAFYLPAIDRHAMIRPWPEGRRDIKARPGPFYWKMAEQAGLRARDLGRMIVIYGPPVARNVATEEFDDRRDYSQYTIPDACAYEGFNSCRGHYYWTECPRCHRVGIEFDGYTGRLCNCFPAGTYVTNKLSRRLRRAYERAGLAKVTERPLWHGLLMAELRRVPLYN